MSKATTKHSLFSALTLVWMSVTSQVALAAAACTSNGHEVPCADLKFALFWSLGVVLLFLVFLIWATVFWILMIVHAIKHDSEKKALMWVILMVFTGIIGSLVYYFVVKRKFNAIRVEPQLSRLA
jgi:predicted neutral ceramidase superfamily lipid hydrolase